MPQKAAENATPFKNPVKSVATAFDVAVSAAFCGHLRFLGPLPPITEAVH